MTQSICNESGCGGGDDGNAVLSCSHPPSPPSLPSPTVIFHRAAAYRECVTAIDGRWSRLRCLLCRLAATAARLSSETLTPAANGWRTLRRHCLPVWKISSFSKRALEPLALLHRWSPASSSSSAFPALIKCADLQSNHELSRTTNLDLAQTKKLNIYV